MDDVDYDSVSRGVNQPLWKSKGWLLVFAVATVPALLGGVLLHTRLLQIGRESNLWVVVAHQLFSWYIWAALAPIIVKLGRIYRIEREGWLRSVILHLVFGSGMAFFQISLAVLFSIFVYGEPMTWEHYQSQVVPTLFGRIPSQILVYAMIIGVSYAIEYRRRYSERALRTVSLESELTKARLESLQRQLQPHFLFNALNSISVLTQKGKITDATDMLNDLCDLLRQVLRNQERQQVTLGEELEFVKRYLEIEKVRYGERLKVKMEVPQTSLNSLLPSFMIQLLVENAIRHGIAKKVAGGEVVVTVSAHNGHLRLTVSDNGIGLANFPDNPGMGLRNARNRLGHLYGRDFNLEVANNDQGGVTATLEIPLLILSDLEQRGANER